MTQAYCRILAALLGAIFALAPLVSRAAFMADPDKLYAEMKAAYDKGNAQGWTFYNQEYYLSTIFNTGRAYSLQRSTDPAYPQIEQTTVDIAAGLHYDPLINHEAVPWYVREAAAYVERNNSDPAEQAKAKGLLDRVDALEDPAALAQYADQDAGALVQQYPRDANALLLRVEADWRGWLLTHDPSWRSLALARANNIDFPLADLPETWGPGFLNAVLNASHGAEGYTPDDVTNAQALETRIAQLPQLKTIASVNALTHARLMTTLAPADEYFGPMGMSILGIRNELNRVNYLIGYGYAKQESPMAVQVATSIDDLHKVYPRDRDLPQLLYDVYSTLQKIDTPDAQSERAHVRAVLTVEYQDTEQARKLLENG
ncbi:MAG TPA: hypothetical protein VKT72_08290 [Candidatus Baltobacteraceae bacterium]|nr:hypothetical protein [Candidatus Baltobacteraceae bacterium]